jgi:DeoR family transcriptional regulator, suf operon transcriptional repressor
MPNVHPVLASMPATRRQLLDALKRAGGLGAEELAAVAGISASAVRQQLTALERDGLVHSQRDVAKPSPSSGRPRQHYRLTAAADALYPRAYGELTTELLDYLCEDDPEAINKLFARRRERRIDQAKRRLAQHPELIDKIKELSRILDEDGYLAEVEQYQTGFWITEHNCAILDVALRYGQACSSELEFLAAALPEAVVKRVAHMVDGAHVCRYQIEARV